MFSTLGVRGLGSLRGYPHLEHWPRLEDLTKAMATGQMWTQAQPAERACRGAAAAERRLNGVAYTAPKSRLPKKTER